MGETSRIPKLIRVQERLRERCLHKVYIETEAINSIAGADVSYDADTGYAAAVVMSYPHTTFIGSACAMRRVNYPYIPGFFAFREVPLLLSAVRSLRVKPDVIMANGHGYAHPRRFGLASHLGVLLGIPTIGIARRLLTGSISRPPTTVGSTAPVIDDNEIIGMAVGTAQKGRPVIVSAGYGMNLQTAVRLVVDTTCNGRSLPEPLRQADHLSRKLRAEFREEMQ
jgi:deoxyribonuclease V